MKKIITFLGVLFLFFGTAFATKHTIRTTPSMTFDPATTTASVGDTIVFTVGGIHTATQISQSAWEANDGNPLGGGFNFGPGTFEYVLTANDLGTIYFICLPHASMGMKGTITVQGTLGIESSIEASSKLRVFPNVVKENQTVSVELSGVSLLNIKVYSIGGSEVKSATVKDSKIDLPATFGRGVYLICVTDSNGKTHVQKIFVE